MRPPLMIAVVAPTHERFQFFMREMSSTGRCVFVRVLKWEDVCGHVFDDVLALHGADWQLVQATRTRLKQ